MALLEQNPAVALFEERARALEPGFALSPTNAGAVGEICVRLDGLPLAIELAAARIKLLPPPDLLERLAGSFGYTALRLLTRGARDLPNRQQTLRQTIEWSYNFLKDSEKKTFWRLATFAGGCSLEAAETVCGDEFPENSDRATPVVLDDLYSLVDQSMIRRVEGPAVNGRVQVRLGMLETLREFALEQLRASGEIGALRERHVNYFLKLSKEAGPELGGQQQNLWLLRLEAEHDNLRSVLEWVLEDAEQRVNIGLELLANIWRFRLIRGYLSEGRNYLKNYCNLLKLIANRRKEPKL